MRTGNLIKIKQIPGEDAAGNPIQEYKGVYLGENSFCEFDEPITIYDVLVLGETQPRQLSSNLWGLEKL
tara:strand:+ start:639 stop:845 length:207 start_codon:yes stop_codon:yes gene_type:complete